MRIGWWEVVFKRCANSLFLWIVLIGRFASWIKEYFFQGLYKHC
jgi:hypothetical protein